MAAKIFFGIDPGKEGGITQIMDGFAPKIHELPLAEDRTWDPVQMRALATMMRDYKAEVGIEKVHMFPGMSAAASAQVLAGYYLWIGTLTALEVPVMEIRAEDWRTEFDLKVPIDCKCDLKKIKADLKVAVRSSHADLKKLMAEQIKAHELEKEAAYQARKDKAFAFARLTFGDHFTTPRGRKLDGPAEAAIIALYVKRKRG